MAQDHIDQCVKVLVEQEGIYSDAVLATLSPADFSGEYLRGLGLHAVGTRQVLLNLHKELMVQQRPQKQEL